MMPATFHFVIAFSYFGTYLSETVKIHELLSISVSSRVTVWFTSCNGHKIVGFWSENTSRNSWKKFEVFSGMAAAENHARIFLWHCNTYSVFENMMVTFLQSITA
jgi:hypothetical protein